MTCGILVPRPRMEPRALAVRESPNQWTTRELPGNPELSILRDQVEMGRAPSPQDTAPGF